MTGYHAFISCSDAADGPRARALHAGLQRLAKPWFRLPTVKVFRDETSLSANPGLWSELERNLERSQHPILLASPPAVRSAWIEREVAWWIMWDPVGGRRVSETRVGQGEDEDSINRLHFTVDGMTVYANDAAIPAHPSMWIESICRRTDPALSQPQWKRTVGTAAYPWTCSTINGVIEQDVKTRTSRP